MSELEPTRTYSNHTATDELRRLLDERGVEWWQSANTLGCIFTRWHSPIFGDEVVAMENGDGELELFSHLMTPEQAIAATLGATDARPTQAESSGTCEMEYVSDWMSWHCKACGQMSMAPRNPKPRYCKWCGRKVVEPTTNDVDAEVDDG